MIRINLIIGIILLLFLIPQSYKLYKSFHNKYIYKNNMSIYEERYLNLVRNIPPNQLNKKVKKLKRNIIISYLIMLIFSLFLLWNLPLNSLINDLILFQIIITLINTLALIIYIFKPNSYTGYFVNLKGKKRWYTDFITLFIEYIVAILIILA